jgi:hypothetical protein
VQLWFVFDYWMASRQHALVQDARDEDSPAILAVEDHVLALLDPMQAGMNLVARTAQGRARSKPLTAIFDLSEIPVGLSWTPVAQREFTDA